MHAGLSLPPRVDDRALTAAHHLKEPAPGLGIDGLLAERVPWRRSKVREVASTKPSPAPVSDRIAIGAV